MGFRDHDELHSSDAGRTLLHQAPPIRMIHPGGNAELLGCHDKSIETEAVTVSVPGRILDREFVFADR
jgi:hypothetical protein